jgi:hypothetical protein
VPSTHARVNMGATGTFAGHFQAATSGCKCRFRQLGRAAPERTARLAQLLNSAGGRSHVPTFSQHPHADICHP